VPLRELNQHTSAVIATVARGVSVVITRNGRPVARMVPVAPAVPALDQLVATGRAIAPSVRGHVPSPPVRGADGVDLARALSADRDCER
jgi:prevent-host-death family protein